MIFLPSVDAEKKGVAHVLMSQRLGGDRAQIKQLCAVWRHQAEINGRGGLEFNLEQLMFDVGETTIVRIASIAEGGADQPME